MLLWLKKNLFLLISIIVGIALFIFSDFSLMNYNYRSIDNIINSLVLSMGSGTDGWNGVVFPILAAIPYSSFYIYGKKQGINLQKMFRMGKLRYIICELKNASIYGGIALFIPYLLYTFYLLSRCDISTMAGKGGEVTIPFLQGILAHSQLIYWIILGGCAFVCGAVFSIVSMGICYVTRNVFCGMLIPFGIMVLVAIISPIAKLNLMLLYSPNSYLYTSLFCNLIMIAVLLIVGFGMVILGVYRIQFV